MSILSSLMGTMQSGGAGEAAKAAADAAASGQAGQAVQKIVIPATEYGGPGDHPFWLPVDAAVTTGNVDWLYYLLIWMSAFWFVLITGAVVYFVWKYRARDGHKRPLRSPHHNNSLEITWTVIPALICVFLFIWGWRGYIDTATPPEHAMEISITGIKWNWQITYPNGYDDPNNELHVPVNRSVKLIMTSNDVIHSFFIPAFRIKKDVVPARYTHQWFKATQPGVYRVYCTEYCGKDHSLMKTVVVVHEPGEYDKYVKKVAEFWETGLTPAERGKKVFDAYCVACHTLDGSTKIGPSFKNIQFGTEHEMADGSKVVVDENYILESITDPQAKIRKGYPGSMPSFKGILSQKKMNGMIAFIKGLNQDSAE